MYSAPEGSASYSCCVLGAGIEAAAGGAGATGVVAAGGAAGAAGVVAAGGAAGAAGVVAAGGAAGAAGAALFIILPSESNL